MLRCRRLGLTPLCYLWQRDQDELLDEMVNNDVEAIIIKVAGIGLKPAHLGKSLSEMQTKLRELVCFLEVTQRSQAQRSLTRIVSMARISVERVESMKR